MDIRRVVGQNVRRYRLAAGLTQEELAAEIGVGQGYLSHLEAGKRNPTILTLWHTARALRVKPNQFFETTSRKS